MNLIAVLEDLLREPSRCGTSRVIAIDGRAGAGKTTLAHELFLAFGIERKVEVIHMDEIYSGWEDALGQRLTDTLTALLENISRGAKFQLPIFNWENSSFDSTREVSPVDLLILEGVGSAQSIVREYTSATIWLDVEASIGLRRVLVRDGNSLATQMQQWQLDEDAHFANDKTQQKADFVLSTV